MRCAPVSDPSEVLLLGLGSNQSNDVSVMPEAQRTTPNLFVMV